MMESAPSRRYKRRKKRLMYKSTIDPHAWIKKIPEKRDPKPNLLRIDGDWKDAVKSLTKKKTCWRMA